VTYFSYIVKWRRGTLIPSRRGTWKGGQRSETKNYQRCAHH